MVRYNLTAIFGCVCNAGVLGLCASTAMAEPPFIDVPNRVSNVDELHIGSMDRSALHPVAATKYDTSILPGHDHRRDVLLSESRYDAVGHIEYGGNGCTGTYGTIQGYEDINGRALVLSAAHCFDVVGGEGLFRMQYLDLDGNPQIYESAIADIYEVYQSNNVAHADLALFTVVEQVPEEIQPAQLIASGDVIEGDSVSIAGFSVDKAGMTEDSNCYVHTRTAYEDGSQLILTNCGLSSQSSGAPIIVDESDDAISLNVSGVTLAVFPGGAVHQLLTQKFLLDTPFLKETDDGRVCARVTASQLNIRTGPDIQYDAFDQFNAQATIEVIEKQGEWFLTNSSDIQSGWVFASYLASVPCPI